MSTSTLTGRAHGANGRRATSGSSIDICLRIEHKSTCFTAVLSTAPFYSLHYLIRSSHICIAMAMVHAGLQPKRTLLALFQTVLLIEFPYCVRHLSVYVLRPILAGRECCTARLHDNQ